MPPLASVPQKYALSGRVVCMDDALKVLPHGTIYIAGGSIAAVQEAAKPAPAGFESIKVTDTAGTIFPGLIELHNHLSYNALQLWDVPRKYPNRDEWAQREPDYQQLVAGPMRVLGSRTELLPAIARYVEAKCLVAGVTTTQGIRLVSAASIVGYYRGCIRNVDEPHDPKLPTAGSHIPDVAHGKDWHAFFDSLKNHACVLLHLSEGDEATARKHFLDLLGPDKKSWAINKALAAIHCVGLEAQDFGTLAAHGASFIWSPLSNLLLYGETARVSAAKQHGLNIGLGSDWSPSGSKNLLAELKVAHVWSKHNADLLSDQEIVAMATRNAAKVLSWDKLLGSIEPGKYADLLVIHGKTGDAYGTLIKATEKDVQLVVVGGVPRFGDPKLMSEIAPLGESVKVGGSARMAYFGDDIVDPKVAKMSLGDAAKALSEALKDVPKLAKSGPTKSIRGAEAHEWHLALDELADAPSEENQTRSGKPPLPLIALELDALTIADDSRYLHSLSGQPNLPAYMAAGVKAFY
jgi:5-methylthioadenosine/S-adenosylhomocysteine deaminase